METASVPLVRKCRTTVTLRQEREKNKKETKTFDPTRSEDA